MAIFSNNNRREGNAQVGEQIDVNHDDIEIRTENTASGNDVVDQQIGIDLSNWRR